MNDQTIPINPDPEKTMILGDNRSAGNPIVSDPGKTEKPENSGKKHSAKLRNVDREIKLTIPSAAPLPELNIQENQVEPALGQLDSIYSIGNELGKGGQGTIRSAFDGGLKREIAIKTLHKELNSSTISRSEFINEARLTAALDHPAVIPIYNLCSDDGNNLHLAMKKLRGISLREYLKLTNERYTNAGFANFDEETAMARRLSLFIKVCEAMSYVHSRKVIHCDLKPENIMLGQYGEVYIVDWGIARRFDSDAPASEKIMGTPRYTSPENLLGMPCDNRSDIYSLGVILFEIVTLNPAFSATSSSEVIAKVKQGKFNALHHRYGHRIAKDLAAVIAKATAFNPEERYQSTDELTADLQAFRRGAEVSANPDSFVGKILRWANRNRRKAAAAAAGSMALLLAAGIISVFAANMRNAEIEHMMDNAIDNSLASAVQNAVQIDRMLTHISAMLGVLNADIALLLDINRPSGSLGNPEIVPGDTTAARCNGSVCFIPDPATGSHFTPGKTLDLSRATYIHAGENAPENLAHILSCLRPAVSRLRRTVLRSRPGSGNVSNAELQEDYRNLRLPVSFCYFTLANGLHIVYPGNDDIRNGYDGRNRPWYKLALGKGGIPVWSVPYRTILEENSSVVSCSMEIIGAREKVHGVAGVDVPLKVLGNIMLSAPDNAIYTQERILTTLDGKLIFRSLGRPDGFTAANDAENTVFNNNILAEMRTHRYGRMVRNENGKDILWIFSLIPSAQWIYVEKIDLAKLMLINRISQQ